MKKTEVKLTSKLSIILGFKGPKMLVIKEMTKNISRIKKQYWDF